MGRKKHGLRSGLVCGWESARGPGRHPRDAGAAQGVRLDRGNAVARTSREDCADGEGKGRDHDDDHE